tara:strand:- start:1 stop:429 length:429 start_codon:yes stop_codon:yes gene_type:complete
MIFYHFDLTSLPIIKINLKGEITSKNIDDFLTKWLEIYDLHTKHTLIFDITKTHSQNVQCAIKLAKFIKKVKMEKPQLLQRSIIILNENTLLRYLFKIIFTITKPIAPVFFYWKKKHEKNINTDTILDIFHTNILKFQYIRP